ncbi:MAG: DUF58 domain-containing protein [Methylotenera sp.]|uniref:DUF58 domain-containing protein n=1 Tax=Methylotenera sp. TaxID=2051956 RepID=UPI0024899870|nr:DUF58 domain-containing protein [Methylotenera sp.]MDI1308387.1 DUF58 domain-containing protein [Methylotenera sp.]
MAKGLNLSSDTSLKPDFKLNSPKTWFRTAIAIDSTTTLSRRHIYILPTRFGWLYGLLLIGLLTGSINYSISLGFAITFLLAGLGLIGMLHTWRNLANLKIEAKRANPVFAGEQAVFEFNVIDDSNRARYSIFAAFADKESDIQDIPALGESTFRLSLPSQKRGWLKAPRITLSTEFPVSLFHVWAYAETENQCLIYPHPSLRSQILPSADTDGATGQLSTTQGDDDFAGHLNYQFGDSPKRIDWKASSREQGMLVKQFQGEASSTLWLDFNATTGNNIELRISQLTRWLVDADAQQLKYGLRLPQHSIQPNSGAAHYHQCLTALALM